MEFVKGHGTENDFVILPDLTGGLDLTKSRVAALCDRNRGLGADGVLRVIPCSAVEGVEDVGAAWFMDYRNADGSVAEMCGNGLRLFARYLVESGLEEGPTFEVGTRSGTRIAQVDADGTVAVGMGTVVVGERSTVTIEGQGFDGVGVDVGNPHLVCVTDIPVEHLDLTLPPGHDPAAFPHGVNVEFVNVITASHIRMRVHERGVGETRSCGTGTVAAVAAVMVARGDDVAQSDVDVPGGRVHVDIENGIATLSGPAVIVARGTIDPQWWRTYE